MNYFKRLNLWAGWLAFAASAVVYMMTIEPTASLWDCGEFIATSYKLEVGHPPGAPLFMMISRLFTLLAFTPAQAAVCVNAMSGLCSAFTILFLFWSITHLGRRIYNRAEGEMTKYQTWAVIGAGLIGSLAYTFTDTFWFSAVEGEVYAMSSLFTALVFWAILKWENVADEPHSNRWLVLIAYLMGLSIGVHILNLLCIPALVFVYYFKKYPKTTAWGSFWTLVISGVILFAINGLIMPYTVSIGAWFDRMMTYVGLPVNAGMTIYVLLLFALTAWGVLWTHKKGKVLANTIVLCAGMILLGYTSYASVVIRASANPPMNSNDPNNPYGLYALLGREQYGQQPLLKGPYYSSPLINVEERTSYMVDENGKYQPSKAFGGYEYAEGFEFLFPRMWSGSEDHIAGYKRWVDIRGKKKMFQDEMITVPTFGENLQYFFSYQLNFMYIRYFMWNFVGRQSDAQSHGQITDGNWLSGVNFVDEIHLGPQKNLPDEMKDNKGRNKYYFLPFILGILGMLYHLNRDPKNFTVVMMLFLLMGVALVLYFNSNPIEPRERDYVFAGSFYAFCIWVGLGVMWLSDLLSKMTKKQAPALAAAATVVCSSVPIILAAQNWDDHDRSHRYIARDIGWNYLESCLPNSIIMNYGDNDTFPLWYNQEVESVRTDVRIMNMTYLMGDWYVKQMLVRTNESAPVPFSLPRHKFINNNERLYVQDITNGQRQDLKMVMDFVASDHPRTVVNTEDGQVLDYLPARKFSLPVNKENAIACGMVKPEDAHLIVDTVEFEISRNILDKGQMMFLDLLANFDWARPLYFTQLQWMGDFIGLKQYLQFDGYAYRLVPIKSPADRADRMGRIDVDYLYERLMNTFRYGNIKDLRVDADYFTRYHLQVAQSRNAFARLADALSARGDSVRAVEVIDRAVAEMPTSQVGYEYVQMIPLIEAYYNAGAMEKGDAMLSEYARALIQYVKYYDQFKGAKAEMVAAALNERMTMLISTFNMAQDYGREELVDQLYSETNQR